MKSMAFMLIASLLLSVLSSSLADAHDAVWSRPISWEMKSLFYFEDQFPAHSTQNPDNAFLKLHRDAAVFQLRPDLFLDFFLASVSVKPRVAASYRWWEDGAVKGETDDRARVFMNEWMFRVHPFHDLYVSFGKEKLLWGSSFLVSPSNILFRDTERENPKTEVEGKYLAKAMYLPTNEVTMTALGRTQQEEDLFGRKQAPVRAVKVDYQGSSAMMSVISYIQRHERFRLGSYGQWTASDAVVLYYDGIVTRGTDVLYPRQDASSPFGARFEQSYGSSSRLFPVVTAGGSYTFLSGDTVGLEFLYNGTGYRDDEAVDYYRLRSDAADSFFANTALAGQAAGTLAQSLNRGSAFLRRSYIMAQFQKREVRNVIDIMLRCVYGTEERTAQIATILEWQLTNRLQFFNVNTFATGGTETEFNAILSRSIMAGVELFF